jgi:hypothetical protein
MKKNNKIEQLDKPSDFWFCAGLLAILLVSIMSHDISRPFYGLHSWDEASAAWRARAFLNYDLEYTKGFAVWAVGDPPTENPNRSLDHPQLKLFMPALEMSIFGINERAIRIGRIIRTLVSLLIFLKIMRALVDKKTALLAGLYFCLFPIVGYFGGRSWVVPVSLLSIWNYLVIIGHAGNKNKAKSYHKWFLAISLFFALQMSWEGFCYALAIGVHYVFRAIHRKRWPEKSLLAILILAPLTSLMLSFTIMAAGHNWDWQKIWLIYKWRATSGEMETLTWSMWFGRFWEHALTNFTLPVLMIVIAYWTVGQLYALAVGNSNSKISPKHRPFPRFWLFLMPAVFQLFLFKGALWPHQYWEYPLVPFLAISTALAVMLLWDFLRAINHHLAKIGVVLLVGIISISCMIGLNYYYGIRWQATAKIEMLKMLKEKIPANKALLSFDNFTVNQHPVKGPHYRPEIAWYLDREIESAQSINDIKEKAATGQYPFYLLPTIGHNKKTTLHLQQLRNGLEKRYKLFTYIPGQPSKKTKDGKFLRAGMSAYIIFDLNSLVGGG